MSRSLFCAVALSLLLVAPAGRVPTSAQADAGQLCRSVSTVLFAPTDVIVAPYAIYNDMSIGFEDYSDHWFAIAAGTVPGIAFLGFMHRAVRGVYNVGGPAAAGNAAPVARGLAEAALHGPGRRLGRLLRRLRSLPGPRRGALELAELLSGDQLPSQRSASSRIASGREASLHSRPGCARNQVRCRLA